MTSESDINGIDASNLTERSWTCQLCDFEASSFNTLSHHVKDYHAPVYSCDYCSFETKVIDEIKTHLDYQCISRPPKCYTCLVCDTKLNAVEDIAQHFREKHQITSENIPVCAGLGSSASSPTEKVSKPQNGDYIPAEMHDTIVTHSKQKDFQMCTLCPFKSKEAHRIQHHMKLFHSTTADYMGHCSKPVQYDVEKLGNPLGCLDSNKIYSPKHFTANTNLNLLRHAHEHHHEKFEGPPKEVKPPKEKTLSCRTCDFKTAYSQNLRRHEKNHKDIYPTLYPERYAREEAKKTNALAECKKAVISDNSQSSSSDGSKVSGPLSNLVSVPDNNVHAVKPVEVLPLSTNLQLTKSVAEPTMNSTVSSVKVTDNPNSATLLYKLNKPIYYSCNYCSFKTKLQDEIRTHLDFQCTLRPPKCYTCLLCNNANNIIYNVADIERHFREKHPKCRMTTGNVPVRVVFGAPNQEVATNAPPNAEVIKRLPTLALPTNQLQPMMMTPSRQKDILEGFHLCRYCPYKSKKPSEVNDHMKA